MKWPQLVPYVEITTVPNIRRKRDLSPSPPSEDPVTEPEDFQTPPPKKKRRKESTGNAGIPQSPTLSDFGYDGRNSNHLPLSPTVSELAPPDDSSTPNESADEITLPRETRSAKAKRISDHRTYVSSGSNIRLEDMPSTSRTISRLSRKSTASVRSIQDADPAPPFDFSNPDPCQYEVLDDELIESEDLAVPGETSSADIALADDEAPVRLLRDFAIYNGTNNEMVLTAALTALAYSGAAFAASGDVSAWPSELFDSGDVESSRPSTPSGNDDNEPQGRRAFGQRIKLSKILELSVHDWSPDEEQIDPKIYLRTKFAWYILDSPSEQYRPFFLAFWLQSAILNHFAMSAINSPQLSYRKFLEDLRDTDSDLQLGATEMLGRHITKSDIEADETRAYLTSVLPDFCLQNEMDLAKVPLIKNYFSKDNLDLFMVVPTSSSHKRSKKRPATQRTLRNRELDILKHRTQTVITPTVSKIAKNLFKGSLEVAGASSFQQVDNGVAAAIQEADHTHVTDPTSMQWGPATEDGKWFTSVIVDGVTYKIGDDVMVASGSDDNAIRVKNDSQEFSQSINSYANRLWFCKICYFYQKKDKGRMTKMFHGQWFLHGSKTILQETSHSSALYLTYSCDDDLPVASIFKKCHISILGPEDPEPDDNAQPDANHFHCSLAYDEEKAEFIDLLSQDEIANLLDNQPDAGCPPCISCAIDSRNTLQQVPIPLRHTRGFTYYGTEYHQYDFIYLCPTSNVGVFQIAQILDFVGDDHMKVQYYGRLDDFIKEWKLDEPANERCLYQQLNKIEEIDFGRLNGICHVLQRSDPEEIETWIAHDDHFYLNSIEASPGRLSPLKRGTILYCKPCGEARTMKLAYQNDLLERNGPIVALELFSGAGGLSTGIDMSGYVQTKYAVEFSPSAALTHAVNHPDTTVYCQDTSNLLRYAIESAEGKSPPPLCSYADKKILLPSMPKRDEIDFIYGGPPCQSFSKANHRRKADDIRSTLPGNMLSYVEHYNPSYFLLENVTGLLEHPLMSTADGRALKGGIRGGMVKFIVRTLIALGYQVRFRLLQAGSYGAPQSRRRVIFLGAKRGIKLPAHPLPTYAFPRGMHKTTLPTGQKVPPLTRSLNSGDPHQCAPLHPVTVNETISDLPAFDWENPHLIVPAKPKDKVETRKRREAGILQFDATRSKAARPVGFPEADGVKYATKPKNSYQQWLRKGNGNKVKCHYTKRYGEKMVEATTTVPLEGGKCHRDLPLVLQPEHAKPGQRQSVHAFFGRMHGDAQFKCALTAATPNVKGTWLLHPTQKRMLTVREIARAQGFPDWYTFESTDEETSKKVDNQVRQIGNAVPVRLALALGKSIAVSLLDEWEKREREGSPIV